MIKFIRRKKATSEDRLPPIKGTLTITALDADGNMLWKESTRNLVVNDGREQMLHLLAGDVTNRSITQISFGTNNATQAVSDTAITNEFKKAIGAISYPTATSMLINWTLGTSEGNGQTYYEFGLLCANNKLFSRLVRAGVTKTSSIQLVGTWRLDF